LKERSLKSGLRALAPRTIRAHRILGGQLRGRIIVTSLHDYPAAILGRTERALLEWFRNNVKTGETWLDVGAHYGYTAIALAELVGVEGRVYAFEPSLTTAGYLNRTRTLNRLDQIKVVPLGLAEPGGLRMVSAPIDRGMANHGAGQSASQDMYLIGFDQLWEAFGNCPVHGVKIDVQGMELQVLAGMTQMLTTQRPRLVLEFHSGVDRGPILQILNRVCYRVPGTAVGPNAGETEGTYQDDHSYSFQAL
jgi:FkbM family methyltransferase